MPAQQTRFFFFFFFIPHPVLQVTSDQFIQREVSEECYMSARGL